jgi:regulator of replication initiation timing
MRIDALEREAVQLRERIERARAATGEDARVYVRRLHEENEALRRENAELKEQIRATREQQRARNKRNAGQGIQEMFDFLARLLNR